MPSFDQICRDIEGVKIQGAENIAKAAVQALKYRRDSQAIRRLVSLRPTEPALKNAVHVALKAGIEEALDYFAVADRNVSAYGASLIKNKMNVYTHCHSSTVNRIFKKAHESKKFKVYNTESRPLLQGRLTSQDLGKLDIPNVHMVDSAMRLALKECDLALIGADAVTEKRVINKIGSELAAETAFRFKVPLYVCTLAWKFDPKAVLLKKETTIEQRSSDEIWKNVPRGVKVVNPAFEQIDPKYIKGVVSEFGILSFEAFVKRVKKEYDWMFE